MCYVGTYLNRQLRLQIVYSTNVPQTKTKTKMLPKSYETWPTKLYQTN